MTGNPCADLVGLSGIGGNGYQLTGRSFFFFSFLSLFSSFSFFSFENVSELHEPSAVLCYQLLSSLTGAGSRRSTSSNDYAGGLKQHWKVALGPSDSTGIRVGSDAVHCHPS